MRIFRWIAVLVCMVGSTLAFAPAGAEPQVHVVYVGRYFKGNDAAPYTYTRFLPGKLKVHRGDIVEWRFFGGFNAWHSVAFNLGPEEIDPMLPDEHPGHIRYSDTLLFGTQPPHGNGNVSTATHEACGRYRYMAETDLEPCVLRSPNQVLASALMDQFFTSSVPPTMPDGSNTAFRVKIADDAVLADYQYECVAHVAMKGTISVVPDSEPVDPPMTDAQLDAEVEKDYREAVQMEKDLSADAYDAASRQWTVWVGKSTPSNHVAVTAYIPAHLEIRRGETVRYIAGTSEPNSVTFPGESGGSFANCSGASCKGTVAGNGVPYGAGPFSQAWGCDIDGDGPAPGAMFAYVIPRLKTRVQKLESGCLAMARREVYMGPLAARETRSPGDLVYHGVFHNSGMMFSEDSPDGFRKKPDGTHFLSEFRAVFPASSPEPISYVCYAHPDQMKGSIRVR